MGSSTALAPHKLSRQSSMAEAEPSKAGTKNPCPHLPLQCLSCPCVSHKSTSVFRMMILFTILRMASVLEGGARFASARQFAAYLGLTPKKISLEFSSDGHRRRPLCLYIQGRWRSLYSSQRANASRLFEGLFRMKERPPIFLKNAIWKNPVGWSAKVAGSRLRLFFAIALHIFISASLFCLYWLLAPICHQHPSVLIGPTIILVGLGIAYPVAYVYAIHRLLNLLKDKGDVYGATGAGREK